jgi:ubiquinone/menaquinone biosynthesis C-methylase UbiE
MTGHPFAEANTVRQQVGHNFDHVAERYDNTEKVFSEPIAARLLREAGIGPGDRVLDVGCGTGAVLLPAAALVQPRGQVTGVDLSAQMLTGARARAHDAGLHNIQLAVGDAEDPPDPPCPDGSFDKVTSSLMFYLLPHPEQAARRWLRLLRPGGMLAFSWQVSEDPEWAPALIAADSYVPDGAPKFTQMLRHWPFMSVRETEDMLVSCGYVEVTTAIDHVPSRYPSPAAWWQSGWERARRISWQHIPESLRPAARDEVVSLLDPLRDPADGSVTRTPRYGWTIARKPAGAGSGA